MNATEERNIMQTTDNKPDAGYGYVLIDTPEKKAKYAPKLSTDECFNPDGQWKSPLWDDGHFSADNIYRRRIDPGEGWEIVPEERWRLGDQFTTDGVEWFIMVEKDELKENPIIAFRRRITTQLALPIAEWIDLPTVPPEGERFDSFLIQSRNGEIGVTARMCLRSGTCRPIRWFNHPPPPPVKSEAERAWEAWLQVTTLTPAQQHEAFIAGFNAGRSKQ